MLLVKAKQGYLPLENRTNFSITTEYEGEQSLSFDILPSDPNFLYLKEESQLRFEDNVFLIKAINQRKNIATISARLNMDDWKERIHRRFFHKEILFTQLIELIRPKNWTIEGAGSVVGSVDFELAGCSDYEILMTCKKLYGVVYEYHTASRMIKIVFPDRIQTRGLYMSDELNLQNLEFKGTSTNLLTRLYAYGKKTEEKDSEGNIIAESYVNFAAINGGKEYIDNQSYSDKIVSAYWHDDTITDPEILLSQAIEKLKAVSIPERSYSCKLIDLSRVNPKYRMLDFRMYDKPTLIDHTCGLYITHQIVQYKRYPDNEKLNEVALSTAFKNITGTIDGIKQSLTSLDTEIRQGQTLSNEIIRDVASNTARIQNTYTKGETDTIVTSTVQQSADVINQSIQALEDTVHTIDTNLYHAVLQKNGSVLTIENPEIEITCILYEWSKDVTKNIPAIAFNWKRSSGDLAGDAVWNESHKGRKSIMLTSDDLDESASFGCEVNAAAGTIIQTSYETIIDETDLVMPSVLMYSDMPLIQQYQPEEKTYHPDWSKMTVFPIIRLNGTELDLKDSRITISYKRKDGTNPETNLIDGETVNNGVLTISKNMLAISNSKIITYIGYVEYQSKTIHDSITFTLVQDGEKGASGNDGADGKDAAERYTWIAYADNAQGVGMSSSPDGKKYLGVAYNKTVKTPSTNPADYSWSLIKGSDGTNGTNGKNGKDAAIQVDSEPSDRTMMWCDTSANPPVLKRWDGTAWIVVNDYNDQIVNTKQQITQEYNSAIQQTKESITQSVEKVKTIADEQAKIISGLKNTIELTEEQTLFIKTTVEQLETVIDGKVDVNTIQEWARFNGSTLELGASNSIFKAILTNTELGFYQSGTKVAWISNNELKILKASIEQYLTIGKSRIEWSDTTGFTIRW